MTKKERRLVEKLRAKIKTSLTNDYTAGQIDCLKDTYHIIECLLMLGQEE